MEETPDSVPSAQPVTPHDASVPLPPSPAEPAAAQVPQPPLWSPTPAPAPAPAAPTAPDVPASFSLAATPAAFTADATTPVPTVTTGSGKRPPRPLLVAGIVAGVVLLAAGAVFGLYLPNTPGSVYSASLSNTAHGIDNLIDYSKVLDSSKYKSVSYDGNLSLKSTGVSFDASLSGASDSSGNSSIGFKTDIAGQKGSAAIRVVRGSANATPDVYFQVSGISQALSLSGLEALNSLDGQWISIDHTLIDTYTARLQGTGTAGQQAAKAPQYGQVNDAARRIEAVNKQYLFTTDSNTAVLTNNKFVATEQVDGRSANHYLVGYNKAHLEAYVDALKKAADSSTLSAWTKQAYGKTLSGVLDLDTMRQQVANAPSTYTFDLWADTQMKVVSKLRFADPSDSTAIFMLSQLPKDNGVYPLSLQLASGSGSDASTTTLSLTIDTKANKFTFGATTTGTGTKLTASLTSALSTTTIHVTAPGGAKPLTDVLNNLGLGGALTPAADTSPFGLGIQG